MIPSTGGNVRLYRVASPVEYAIWITTGKLELITGEKWFALDPAYLDRVKGNIVSGKKKYKDREYGGIIELVIPIAFFTGKLVKKGSPSLPKQYQRLPAFHSGMKDKIQVKCEKGCINFGFFSQALLDELANKRV